MTSVKNKLFNPTEKKMLQKLFNTFDVMQSDSLDNRETVKLHQFISCLIQKDIDFTLFLKKDKISFEDFIDIWNVQFNDNETENIFSHLKKLRAK